MGNDPIKNPSNGFGLFSSGNVYLWQKYPPGGDTINRVSGPKLRRPPWGSIMAAGPALRDRKPLEGGTRLIITCGASSYSSKMSHHLGYTLCLLCDRDSQLGTTAVLDSAYYNQTYNKGGCS